MDALRVQAQPIISLVADDNGTIVGHILFSPVTLTGHGDLTIMGLAPMAVLPTNQRRGIGSSLVRAGLDRCRQSGCDAIVVLGHPQYYPRFGFVPASRFGCRQQCDAPGTAGLFALRSQLDTGSTAATCRHSHLRYGGHTIPFTATAPPEPQPYLDGGRVPR